MTPMSKLKDLIQNFKSPIWPLLTGEFTLNKSKQKYIPHGCEFGFGGYTKGVEADFLRVFKTSEADSFAFIFNNINQRIEDTLISVSIKTIDTYIEKTFTFNEFKTLLKELIKTNNTLKNNNSLNIKNFYIALEKTFKLHELLDIEETTSTILNEIKLESSNIKEEISKNKIKEDKINKELIHSKKKIHNHSILIMKEVSYEQKKQDYLLAKALFEDAEKYVIKETQSQTKELSIKTAEKSLEDTKKKIKQLNNKLNNLIINSTKPYGKEILNLVTKEFYNN